MATGAAALALTGPTTPGGSSPWSSYPSTRVITTAIAPIDFHSILFSFYYHLTNPCCVGAIEIDAELALLYHCQVREFG